MRTLVIGAGAVGGYFGARLAAAGRDITFLVRKHRADQLRTNGLHVISPQGNVDIDQPKLLLAADLAAHPTPFDLILLSTKAYSLDSAMNDFAPAIGPNTVILPLLNGMAHLDALDARFSPARVLGGSTRIVADVDTNGTIHSMEALHDLNFGERDKSVTPRIEAIQTELSNAGFEAKLQPDILAFMWSKWVFLAALGATTCLLRGSIGQIASAPGGLATAQGILNETAAIAAANGYPTSAPFLEHTTARLLQPGSTLTASMYRDMMRGAPVEADHILGNLIARSHTHNVPAPLLTAAHAMLSVYSANRPQ
ncbi:2-dehydropantoate 2-reductase [Granulicella sp. 5B5]|uniref:ketopantoate reductase family protein n=1 Tax=Granulicella sp. 5B5 TaxID=1617967 RepID=UPI0015F733FC|nr:ketopantoate reductase family protein [Granulicella sp. 5B5]QMV18956.1 2-dehydropantoate 2-reductase [Granulicella sp. 5B5]